MKKTRRTEWFDEKRIKDDIKGKDIEKAGLWYHKEDPELPHVDLHVHMENERRDYKLDLPKEAEPFSMQPEKYMKWPASDPSDISKKDDSPEPEPFENLEPINPDLFETPPEITPPDFSIELPELDFDQEKEFEIEDPIEGLKDFFEGMDRLEDYEHCESETYDTDKVIRRNPLEGLEGDDYYIDGDCLDIDGG